MKELDHQQGCLPRLLDWLGLRRSPQPIRLPVRARRVFLSADQIRFFHALRRTVSDWAVICPKVSLNQLVALHAGQSRDDHAWMARISSLSVDFLLCDRRTLLPLLGVILQSEPGPGDTAHQIRLRLQRDQLVDGVLAAAELPVARITARDTYNQELLESYLRRKAGLPDGTSTGRTGQFGATSDPPPAGAP